MNKARALSESAGNSEGTAPVIGVFVAGDPRIDEQSRERCRNIVRMTA